MIESLKVKLLSFYFNPTVGLVAKWYSLSMKKSNHGGRGNFCMKIVKLIHSF